MPLKKNFITSEQLLCELYSWNGGLLITKNRFLLNFCLKSQGTEKRRYLEQYV